MALTLGCPLDVRARIFLTELEKSSKLAAPDDNRDIDSIAGLLQSRGLDASDLIDIVEILAKSKKREAERQAKEEEKEKNKHILEKEYVFETRRDIYIYKSGATKTGRYYVRIHNEKQPKRPFVQSLRTTNRTEALFRAEKIYAEKIHAINRGVKFHSIDTKELVRLYQKERRQTITTIPHQGITQQSFDTMCGYLKKWEEYIAYKRMSKFNIEDIPTEVGKGFGLWIKEQHKQRYGGRERSNETINHAIAAVKKMYRDVAVDEKYITMAEFPNFKYLKVNRETKPKRDILEPEEFTMLRQWMTNKWCREKDITDLERVKRYVYGLYLTIQYYGGFRNKEILGIKWGDISVIKTESEEAKRVNRGVFIPATNSKTGKSRTCVAPVAHQFERIRNHYRKLGITDFGRDDFVFINLAKTKRGTNTPYDQPAMEKRLKAVIEGSGLKKILDETGRHITQYSARHYAATDALMRGVSIYDTAINLGTSVFYIEQTYSHITALKRSMEITKGQGLHKVIKERAENKEFDITEDGGVKVGPIEHSETGNGLKVHYAEIYREYSEITKKVDDLSWLDILRNTPSKDKDHQKLIKELEERCMRLWGTTEMTPEIEKEYNQHLDKAKKKTKTSNK